MIKNIFKNKVLKRLVAITCAGIMTLSLTACGSESSGGNSLLIKSRKYDVVRAAYPKTPACPSQPKISGNFSDKDYKKYEKYQEEHAAWHNEIISRSYNGSTDNLVDYWVKSINVMLNDSNTKNRAYSPVNLYFALGMLSELTDGDSRQQILEALGYENVEELRNQANNIWKSCYLGDGSTSLLLGNSLWLNDGIKYKKDTLQILADKYYASTFSGKMGSEKYTKEFRKWLNDNTKNLLKNSVDKLELDPSTVMALASTIYYKATWQDEFNKSETKTDTFNGVDGATKCKFMNSTENTRYYKGDGYQLAAKGMQSDAGYVWFILPDEGVGLENVLESGEAVKYILTNREYCTERINYKIPKFDVTVEIDLIEKLKELGIKDVFDSSKADFSPMMDNSEGNYVSQAKQAVRIIANEEGVEAAAFTVMDVNCACPIVNEPINFTLDRPFAFMITSRDNFPLFAGSINSMK